MARNQNFAAGNPVNHHVRTTAIGPDRWIKFSPLAGQLRIVGQQFEKLPEPEQIGVRARLAKLPETMRIEPADVVVSLTGCAHTHLFDPGQARMLKYFIK